MKDWLLSMLKEADQDQLQMSSPAAVVAWPFQRAEAVIPRGVFADILRMIAELRLVPLSSIA